MTDYCCYSGNSDSFIKLMLVMMILMVVIIMITISLLMMTDNDQISEEGLMLTHCKWIWAAIIFVYFPNIHGHTSEMLIASISNYFPMNLSTPQNMKKKNVTIGKINPEVCCFYFFQLLKWWWMAISRLKLLWPSCRPAFAQPAVKLSLKAVVKSCHSLNYDMMSWLHKRMIIWGSSYQDKAKRRGFMCALHPLTGAYLRRI